MFLKKLHKARSTLAFRLAFLYGVIFVISSGLMFLIFYVSASSYVYGRVDAELEEDFDELAELLAASTLEAVKADVWEENKSENTKELFLRLIASDGTEIAATDLSTWHDPEMWRKLSAFSAEKDAPVFATVSVSGKPYDVRIASAPIGRDTVLQAGILLENETRMMAVFNRIFGITMTIVCFLGAITGWIMAKRALSGVEEVTQTAWKISEGALEQRVPAKNRGHEIERMAMMFNYMLDQIQKLIKEMREMTDNIAHDLKSPVTRIRGLAEVTLTTNRSVNEYEQMVGSTIEECDFLLEMINTMLDISEIEVGAGKMDIRKIDLAALVRDICDLFEPLTERKDLRLTVEAPETLCIDGDLRKLQRLIGNLLDNAIKYTPPSGRIIVSLTEEENGNTFLSVNDTGIGISDKDLPYIFERFYRCDQSRTKTGSGLGLCLARAIVKLHQGEINVRSKPNHGSKFTVIFPQTCKSGV